MSSNLVASGRSAWRAAIYRLGYGDWIRILTGAGFVIDDLIEPRPGPGRQSGYMAAEPPDWARRRPAEMLWVAHKR
jgi:hypothetical protein